MAVDGIAPEQWDVLVVGLDQRKANILADFAGRELHLQAEALDPARFIVMYMDRETIQAVRRGIASEPDLQDVVAGIDEWLEQADSSED